MRQLLRPIGVLLTLVLLQLVLVESGYACQLPVTEGTATAMAGMAMPAGAEHPSSVPARSGAPHDQSPSPCQFPWAPNGCQSMAPCSPAALTVATANVTHDAAEMLPPLSLDLLAPTSPSRAPELPPPRA